MEQDEDGYSVVGSRKKEKKERRKKRRMETQQLTEPLAPREKYFRLAFPSGTHIAKKHAFWIALGKWSSPQDSTLDVVKSSYHTSNYVYVNRRHVDLIKAMQEGIIGEIELENRDMPKRRRPYKEYFVTNYPVHAELDDAYSLDGVAHARRGKRNGIAQPFVYLSWKDIMPPPIEYFFFGPYHRPSKIKPCTAKPVVCYRCFGTGHVAKYCGEKQPQCGYCAKDHESKTCSKQELRCLRCRREGVGVFHSGCPRRPSPDAADTSNGAPPYCWRLQWCPHYC